MDRRADGAFLFLGSGGLRGAVSCVTRNTRCLERQVWRLEGRDRYSAVLEFFRFNVDGTFAGTQKVTRTIELSAGLDSFTSNATIQIMDINGQLVPSGSGYATETATRFK
jgi:hypothetical protein